VLDLFTAEEPEWGATAAAERLGVAKSLAHDVLVSLTAIGLLQRVRHGRYRLGWRTLSLATVLLRTSEMKALARGRSAGPGKHQCHAGVGDRAAQRVAGDLGAARARR